MPGSRPDRPVEILLVEDSEDDADLMGTALRAGNLPVLITVVDDGEDAIHYLRQQGKYTTAPRPDLILLDLGLPRKSGGEVLAEIKEDGSLRRIPVVVMTSSANEKDFTLAYDRHANCCVAKPADLDEFQQVVERIERFWLSFIQRPPVP
jgi:CheY-like chemotaxis protein